MINKRNVDFSLGALTDCPVETAVKNGFQKKRTDPYDSLPNMMERSNRGIKSPLIAAFGLDKNGE